MGAPPPSPAHVPNPCRSCQFQPKGGQAWDASQRVCWNASARVARRLTCLPSIHAWLYRAALQDAKDPDTLANLITVGLHLGKNTARYLT